MSVIKTQICSTSPPRCANVCPDISLTYFYFPRENFIFRLDVTPAARRLRRHHCLCRTLSLPAAATAGAAAAHNRRTPYSAAAVVDAFSDNNGETVVPSRMWRRRRRRQATKAAAGGGSCHLNFCRGCTMRDQYIGGGGEEHGELRVLGVFRVLRVFVFLCPDINFMSAILGQNTKYVF